MLTPLGFSFKEANLLIVIACKGPNHHYRRKTGVTNVAIKVGIESTCASTTRLGLKWKQNILKRN